jgi:hypothetical protein
MLYWDSEKKERSLLYLSQKKQALVRTSVLENEARSLLGFKRGSERVRETHSRKSRCVPKPQKPSNPIHSQI